MPKKVVLVEWTELLSHGEDCGFCWNFAHEILRVFQGYEKTKTIYCDEVDNYDPMSDPYIGQKFKEQGYKESSLNQMGRDIVFSFMQKHELKEMVVVQDK